MVDLAKVRERHETVVSGRGAPFCGQCTGGIVEPPCDAIWLAAEVERLECCVRALIFGEQEGENETRICNLEAANAELRNRLLEHVCSCVGTEAAESGYGLEPERHEALCGYRAALAGQGGA